MSSTPFEQPNDVVFAADAASGAADVVAELTADFPARYLLTNRYDRRGRQVELACRIIRISTSDMRLIVPVNGTMGARVIAVSNEFGKLQGTVTQLSREGFSAHIIATDEERARLAARITWHASALNEPKPDLRKHGRIVPKNPLANIVFADGSARRCFVIDVSASGAAVSAEVTPDVGTPLALGCVVGRVIRHFDGGFAVRFIEDQHILSVERLIAFTPRELRVV